MWFSTPKKKYQNDKSIKWIERTAEYDLDIKFRT